MSHNKSKIALAVGIGIWGMQAQAFEIDTGPNVTTSLESVAEFTSVYRTSSPERIERGGQNIFANNNDGSEYYDTGFVSNEFKLTSELHVRTEQDGLFVRGTAWYDTQIMDNGRLRAWRVALKPGEATGPITQTAPGLRIYVHGGVLAEMVPGSADRGMAPYEGDFIWQDAGQTRAVKNTGTTLVEFVEFELK